MSPQSLHTDATRQVIALGAGGTGGHMFPAAALARELMRRGHAVILLTDARGLAFKDEFEGVEIVELEASSPMQGGWRARIASFGKLMKSMRFARKCLKSHNVSCVVGFGGYPSFPAALGAWFSGIPYILHEQNAVLGRVNRLLAGGARAIATSFKHTQRIRDGHQAKVHLTGNPIRADITAVGEKPYSSPGKTGDICILAIGGSQGARVFSEIVPAALTFLDQDLKDRLHVTQQCRPEDKERVAEAYIRANIMAQTPTFIRDVAGEMRSAHIVIARSGAGSVIETAAARRPGIFVPLPIAADDHQTMNARGVTDAGGGWLIPESGFKPGPLAELLASLLRDAPTLKQAANAAHKQVVTGAAAALADLVLRGGQARHSNRDTGAGDAKDAQPNPVSTPKEKQVAA